MRTNRPPETQQPYTMTQAEYGRALLQLVLDHYGPTIGWSVRGRMITTTGANPAAGVLLDAAHLLIYGQTLTNRVGGAADD